MDFEPSHITVKKEDTTGNGGLGRFWVCPGSLARSKLIADNYLTDVTVRESSRGHHAYLGKINLKAFELNENEDAELRRKAVEHLENVDIGVISTGMGAPSVDIVVTELIKQGAQVVVRVGTAGAMSRDLRVGDLVVAAGAVRDEGTTRHYMPLEFPSMADPVVTSALNQAAVIEQDIELNVEPAPGQVQRQWICESGCVHTKDTLMAREFKFGPMGAEHQRYMELLEEVGCLASEMECSMLFTLGQVYRVKSGCVLGIIGGGDCPITDDKEAKSDTERRSCRVCLRGLALMKRMVARNQKRANSKG